MSGGGFQANPDEIRSGASSFGTAGDMFAQAKSRLDTVLSSYGECWGGDESGKAFSQQYVPNADKTKEAFGTLAEAITAIRTALEQTAATYEGSDNVSAGGLGKQGG